MTAFARRRGGELRHCHACPGLRSWPRACATASGGGSSPPVPGPATRCSWSLGNTLPRCRTAPTWCADLASDGSHGLPLEPAAKSRAGRLPGGRHADHGHRLGRLAPVGPGLRPGQRHPATWPTAAGRTSRWSRPRRSDGGRRIRTPNVKLFDVSFEAQSTTSSPGDTTRRDTAYRRCSRPAPVTGYDYSDRPQYIGDAEPEPRLFHPPDGRGDRRHAARLPDGTRTRLEIITEYAEDADQRQGGRRQRRQRLPGDREAVQPAAGLSADAGAGTPRWTAASRRACFAGPVRLGAATHRGRTATTRALHSAATSRRSASPTPPSWR